MIGIEYILRVTCNREEGERLYDTLHMFGLKGDIILSSRRVFEVCLDPKHRCAECGVLTKIIGDFQVEGEAH